MFPTNFLPQIYYPNPTESVEKYTLWLFNIAMENGYVF